MTLAKPILSLVVGGTLLSVPTSSLARTGARGDRAKGAGVRGTVARDARAKGAAARSAGAESAGSKSAGSKSAGARDAGASRKTTAERALLDSRLLWATIDICNAKDQPNTVGVRGSMPGDEHSKDQMYMSFRLQYINATTKQWVDLSKTAPAYVAVGAAKTARQGGSSFELKPVAGTPAFMMRGVVSFQWRRRSTVEYTISRPTTAGHQSLTGADPAGFTAATCKIG